MARLLLPVPLLLLLATAVEAKPDRGPFGKVAVIRLREETGEQIDPSFKQSVLRRIEQAREWGADCVILDIESYGGLVPASIETGDEIYALGRDVHTIAYVGRKAISGAALLSLSCQEIVMNEVGKIGDCQAVYMTAEGELKQAPEKIQTTVASAFRTYAEGNGYPLPVVEAMVRQEMEVIRYRKRGDPPTWVYYRSDTSDDLPSRREIEEQGLEEPPETVVRAGELAVFTAKQAMEYGIASRTEPSVEALLKSISGPDTEVLSLDWNWTERASRFLLGYKWLLFLLGLGALYFAFKMPGTGIPEALAIVAFGLFFGASAIAGFAGPVELVLFLAGVVLLVVEIFVLPGFGIAGFAGLLCIFVSIGLAALPEGAGKDLSRPSGDFLLPMAGHFLAGAFGALLLAFLLARFLPKIPYFSRLALAPAPPQTGSALPLAPGTPSHPLLAATGVAETDLRPAGRARIGAEHLDVLAEGFVPAGTPVRVVGVRGSVVVVRPDK